MSGITASIPRPTWSMWSCRGCERKLIPTTSGSKPCAVSATFSVRTAMLERVRQSLAFRLAIQYALVFALGSAALFGALYWLLAKALDERERAALVRQTEEFASTFERGAIAALRTRVDNDASANARSFFVRLVGPDGVAIYEKWPTDWVETQIEKIPFGA